MIIFKNPNGKEYYFCMGCNPEKIFDSIEGCYYICTKCRNLIPIDLDKDYECDMCKNIVCQYCIVYNVNQVDDT
jgi:hypothetical protein